MRKESNKGYDGKPNGVAVTNSAEVINDAQYTKYNGAQGYGSAVDDANALNKRFHGQHVEQIRKSNTWNSDERRLQNDTQNILNNMSEACIYLLVQKATNFLFTQQ